MAHPDAVADEGTARGVGSPMATAVLPKSICFAKLLPKNATSAKSDSTFPRALLEVSRYKYRHLTGSAMRSCSILLPGA